RPHAPPFDDPAPTIQPYEAAAILAKINSENCNLHLVSPVLQIASNNNAAGRRGGPSHKLSRSRGGDGRKRGVWQADRDLVSRRSSDRAEKQGHPPMGETRDTAFVAAPPEDEFRLFFRPHLPGRRKRRRARTPPLQQRGYGPASGGNLACSRARRARHRSS